MRGFRLGSVFGFEIRVDYSWFVIFFLILWTLSLGFFPATYPGLAPGAHMAMGLAATLLFFASLLGHELSHSLVARSRGIPIEGITLFIFGGMAHTRMEAEDPRDEFFIAGVGPLSSLVLAGLFLAVAALGRGLGWPVPVTGVAQYLGVINVALAVFNLLPGFPLDGGRLFRAIAWKATGDLTKATRWATTGGKALGYALMLVGIIEFFLLPGGLGGLWLVFIGWFVRTAADASFRQHLLRTTLEGVRVWELMTRDPLTVAGDVTLAEFADRFILDGRHRAYPVTEQGRPVGVISLDHLRSVPREEWSARTVASAMSPVDEDARVPPDAKVTDVLDRLGRAPGGRILVTQDGELKGIITRGDLVRWIDRTELLRG